MLCIAQRWVTLTPLYGKMRQEDIWLFCLLYWEICKEQWVWGRGNSTVYIIIASSRTMSSSTCPVNMLFYMAKRHCKCDKGFPDERLSWIRPSVRTGLLITESDTKFLVICYSSNRELIQWSYNKENRSILFCNKLILLYNTIFLLRILKLLKWWMKHLCRVKSKVWLDCLR